ncbi:MAG: prepilin peptidase [Candidatus Hydrothermarchaeota archaeon]
MLNLSFAIFILILASFFDVRYNRIPNWITMPAIPISFILGSSDKNWKINALLSLITCLLLFRIGMFGGDSKLYLSLSLLNFFPFSFFYVLFSMLVGYSLIRMMRDLRHNDMNLLANSLSFSVILVSLSINFVLGFIMAFLLKYSIKTGNKLFLAFISLSSVLILTQENLLIIPTILSSFFHESLESWVDVCDVEEGTMLSKSFSRSGGWIDPIKPFSFIKKIDLKACKPLNSREIEFLRKNTDKVPVYKPIPLAPCFLLGITVVVCSNPFA